MRRDAAALEWMATHHVLEVLPEVSPGVLRSVRQGLPAGGEEEGGGGRRRGGRRKGGRGREG